MQGQRIKYIRLFSCSSVKIRKGLYYISVFFNILLLNILAYSCIQVEQFENSPRGNFEALWKIMDERYCYFEYKNVDWNKIHDEYSAQISEDMSDESLFSVLNQMLQEVKDGHVNLNTPFGTGGYSKWYEDYPPNFSMDILHNYLRVDFILAGNLKYAVLPDKIGYVYCGDFTEGIGEDNLDRIIRDFSGCDGVIIDVRDNGGGLLSNSTVFASRFINERTLVGYIQHKTGKGHGDFSGLYPVYIEPSDHLRYLNSVIVLTNRKCYSAANDFVNSMRMFPNIKILGDRTGGGGGLPFTSELPNGWGVRFSACPIFDTDMEHIEFGIDPDIEVDLLPSDISKGEDTLVRTARELLKQSK